MVVLGTAMLVGCGGSSAPAESTVVESQQQAPSDAPLAEETPPDETSPSDPEDPDAQRGPDGVGAIAAYGAPAPEGPSVTPQRP
jgi:hypothetical protein